MSKIVVITGSGLGLGRALARRFHYDGDTVVLLGRTLSKVQAVADELGPERALALECDVAVPDSVRTAFAKITLAHRNVDVLINNAAVYEPFLIADATDDQLLSAVATNLTGPMLCARAAIPLMRRGASLINVSSESVGMRFPYLVAYQSSKAGLERFSEGLRHELEPQGIRVTTVRAGQMIEQGKTWNVDPQLAMRFGQAAAEAGLNLRASPKSHVDSVTGVFRALVDLPPDVQIATLGLHARKPD